MTDKIAIFADVQNIYYTTREAFGCQFDYGKLWRRVSGDGEIVAAVAYAIDRGDANQQRFQYALGQIGFEVKLKPFIQRQDGSAKGDWDVDIAIDMLDIAPAVDRIVLLSGDGDFDLLVAKVQKSHGLHVDVYGVPGLTAQSLIDAADRYIAIDKSDLLLGK